MKVGSVPYMNAKPLVWGLTSESDMELVYEVPSKLAVMLKDGELAAGMVSSAACFANPDLRIAPGMSVSSNGPVQSVKLLYNGSVEKIRSVALDTSSLTSVLLARVILDEAYGLAPRFVDMPPNAEEMMDVCDAAVLIGDPAMRVPDGVWSELDLGEEWSMLTGLPFVYAVWAVNPDLATPELISALQRSKVYGMARIEEISESESERLDLPYEVCHYYISEIMDYSLTDEHMRGLALFQDKAVSRGFVSERHPLRLYGATTI